MKKLKIGIIGCGTILSVHLDAIRSFEGAELVIVCDIEADKASEVGSKEQCQWTIDYTEVLRNEEVEVVHILTPHYLHVPMAIEALEHEKHVVLEKPVGINFEQLKQLEEVAQKSDRTVGITFQNRFNPTTIKMKEIMDSRKLGNLLGSKAVLTWCRKESYYSHSSWRGKWATEGGGLLINQAIHTIDLMEYVGGDVETVKATVVNNTHPSIEVEDTAMITMFYKSGAIGNFYGTNSHEENSPIMMEFIFDQGKMVLEDRELRIVEGDMEEVVACDIPKEGNKSYWGTSHKKIIENIYRSILDGCTPKVTLKDAIRATELVLLCYKSEEGVRM